MSAEIVNLRQARKRKKRADKEATAQENRVEFGRSKAEREATRKAREDLLRQVDAHKLDAADAFAAPTDRETE